MTLVQAERYLRQDDKAIRLRHSLEGPHVLVERKTFRGNYNSHSVALGAHWAPDSGTRRELGHVLVATLHRDAFDAHVLRESLREADTWNKGTPHWRRVEEAEEAAKAKKVRDRRDGIRYKASNLFDNYVWKYKQRVNVPTQIR